MFWGCTDLRIGVSGSKFNAEADFEVRFAVALQKSGQHCEKLIFRSTQFAEKIIQRRKMKRRESSETRFPKVWQLYGPCSKGKRSFEVSNKKSKFAKTCLFSSFLSCLLYTSDAADE